MKFYWTLRHPKETQGSSIRPIGPLGTLTLRDSQSNEIEWLGISPYQKVKVSI